MLKNAKRITNYLITWQQLNQIERQYIKKQLKNINKRKQKTIAPENFIEIVHIRAIKQHLRTLVTTILLTKSVASCQALIRIITETLINFVYLKYCADEWERTRYVNHYRKSTKETIELIQQSPIYSSLAEPNVSEKLKRTAEAAAVGLDELFLDIDNWSSKSIKTRARKVKRMLKEEAYFNLFAYTYVNFSDAIHTNSRLALQLFDFSKDKGVKELKQHSKKAFSTVALLSAGLAIFAKALIVTETATEQKEKLVTVMQRLIHI